MYKIIGYDAKGAAIWGDMNGNPLVPSKEITVTAKKPAGKWYESLFTNAGGILTGAGSLISSIKGQPAQVNNYMAPEPDNSKDNTKMMIMAVVVVIILIALFFFLKKSKA